MKYKKKKHNLSVHYYYCYEEGKLLCTVIYLHAYYYVSFWFSMFFHILPFIYLLLFCNQQTFAH